MTPAAVRTTSACDGASADEGRQDKCSQFSSVSSGGYFSPEGNANDGRDHLQPGVTTTRRVFATKEDKPVTVPFLVLCLTLLALEGERKRWS